MNTLFVSNHSTNLDEGYFSDGLLGGAFKTEKSCSQTLFKSLVLEKTNEAKHLLLPSFIIAAQAGVS